jgi:hypothetical protein
LTSDEGIDILESEFTDFAVEYQEIEARNYEWFDRIDFLNCQQWEIDNLFH